MDESAAFHQICTQQRPFQWEAPWFSPPSGSCSRTPWAGAAATSQLHESFPCEAVSQETLTSSIPPPGGIRRWLPHEGSSEVQGGTIPIGTSAICLGNALDRTEQ